MLKIKNTLTGKIEQFKPLKKNEVAMYNCGPTVYNQAHIGNLRHYVFTDLIKRYFEYNNFSVKQVINITDVGHLTDDGDLGEDKIEKEALKQNLSATEISEHYTELFLKDLKILNINTEKVFFPKATEYIKEQIEFIKTLEGKGYIYETKDGIYFDTSKYKNYGQLGNINLTGIQEGVRVDKNDGKKNATDFALWKFSPKNQKRLQEWDSPWGIGFPGWHIECSTMSKEILGETFDIHTGGIEHIPVHHNNEIAQSFCATNKLMAKYWLHINHLLISGEKMSKSKGNVVYLSDIVKNYDPLSYKYWLFSAKYSSFINFSEEAILASDSALKKIVAFLKKINENGKVNKKYIKKVLKALEDDFNTPVAISLIWTLIKDSKIKDQDKKTTILELDKIFGLNLKERLEIQPIPESIIKLANERKEARLQKKWQLADELRQQIESLGFEIKDLGDNYEISSQN